MAKAKMNAYLASKPKGWVAKSGANKGMTAQAIADKQARHARGAGGGGGGGGGASAGADTGGDGAQDYAAYSPYSTPTYTPNPYTPPPALTPAQTPVSNSSSLEVLRRQMEDAGLPSSFGDILFGYVQEGLSDDESDIRLRKTDEWKNRFIGNEQRKAKGMRELSPSEYLSKERALADQFAFFDLPTGFYDDPADFAKAISSDLGADELQERLQARKSVLEDGAMTGVLDWAQTNYGLGVGDLLAFWIDPDRATNVVTKVAAAANIGAAASRSGWGQIGTGEAERLADMGISSSDAQDGYNQAAKLLQLASDVGGDAGVSRDDLTSAVFNTDAGAQQRVQRAADTRKARFQQGGQFATGKAGFAGLGNAAQ